MLNDCHFDYTDLSLSLQFYPPHLHYILFSSGTGDSSYMVVDCGWGWWCREWEPDLLGLEASASVFSCFLSVHFFFASLHGALWRVEADVVSERGVGCCQLKQGGYVMGRRVWSVSQSFKALDFCYPAPPPHALCEPNVDGLKKNKQKNVNHKTSFNIFFIPFLSLNNCIPCQNLPLYFSIM